MNSVTPTVHDDLCALIHPYTNLALHRETGPFVITRERACGSSMTGGNPYIEAMSGL